MQISRNADGLRFLGECVPEKGFISGDIQCAGCGRRIDPRVNSHDVSLVCNGCGFKKAFWAEADMQVYLAENWNRLRQACTHPAVSLNQPSRS